MVFGLDGIFLPARTKTRASGARMMARCPVKPGMTRGHAGQACQLIFGAKPVDEIEDHLRPLAKQGVVDDGRRVGFLERVLVKG